jgi:hypothetical protein
MMSSAVNDAQKDRLLADLDFVTDRLSTQVRQLALGVLAIVWALLVKEQAGGSLNVSPRLLISLAGLAIVTIACDFLQYVAAYFASRRCFREFENGGDGQFDSEWPSYRLRMWCFGAKIVICLFMVIAFLAVVVFSVR